MIDKLAACGNLRQFSALIDPSKVKVEIGVAGGRRITIGEKSYSMNQIVHKLEELAVESQEPKMKILLAEAYGKVVALNNTANLKLKASKPLQKVLTSIRSIFGSIVAKQQYGLKFDKETHLEKYQHDYQTHMMNQYQQMDLFEVPKGTDLFKLLLDKDSENVKKRQNIIDNLAIVSKLGEKEKIHLTPQVKYFLIKPPNYQETKKPLSKNKKLYVSAMIRRHATRLGLNPVNLKAAIKNAPDHALRVQASKMAVFIKRDLFTASPKNSVQAFSTILIEDENNYEKRKIVLDNLARFEKLFPGAQVDLNKDTMRIVLTTAFETDDAFSDAAIKAALA